MLFAAVGCIFFNCIATYVDMIGLQKIDASKFGPINQTINNMVAILGGIIVFGQIIGSIPFYIIGVIMAIFGSVILGRYQITTPPKVIEKLPDLESISKTDSNELHAIIEDTEKIETEP
jgi:drug/metabolite transporter (DMT)-like permease